MPLSYPSLAVLGLAVTLASLFGPVVHVARTWTTKYDLVLTTADRLIVYPADTTPDEIANRVVQAFARTADG